MSADQDRQHLQLLSIFHYVAAGLGALFSLFPIFHLAVGIAMLTGQFDNAEPPPAALGWVFVIVPAIFIIGGLALAICVAGAGRRLRIHTGYTYCLVIAGIECIFMPVGTALGVFTIIVLMRPSVRELFGVDERD